MTNDNFVTNGYSHCGTISSNPGFGTITTTNPDGVAIGGMNTTYYPANQWVPLSWPYYYPTYYPSIYYPTNEAALRETIREKEAVIEEMRELVKMQRQLLKALLPGKDE